MSRAVELVDEFLAVQQVVLWFPGVLLTSITLPPYQVLPLTLLVAPFVHNSFHLQGAHEVMESSINLLRQQLLWRQFVELVDLHLRTFYTANKMRLRVPSETGPNPTLSVLALVLGHFQTARARQDLPLTLYY